MSLFTLQEADRSADSHPTENVHRSGAISAGGLHIPRVLRTPIGVTAAAYMSNLPQTRYGRLIEDAPSGSRPVAKESSFGRRSAYQIPEHPRYPSNDETYQKAHAPGGQFMAMNNLGSVQMAPSRLTQTSELAVMPTQSTITTDSMGDDVSDPDAGAYDDAVRRRGARSMAPPGVMIYGLSPDHQSNDGQSPAPSQKGLVHTIGHTPLRSMSNGIEVPPASLFATASAASQDATDQNVAFDSENSFPRPPSVASKRQPFSKAQVQDTGDDRAIQPEILQELRPGKPQGQLIGQKRPLSAQAGKEFRQKKRKANQSAPVKRSSQWTERQNEVDDNSFTRSNESMAETAGPVVDACSLDHGSTAVPVPTSNDTQMMDHAIQTDPTTRLQADVLYLSAALELNQRLLQEARQWTDIKNHDERLLRLGCQFIRGLHNIFRSI